jgi:hypothetical protein
LIYIVQENFLGNSLGDLIFSTQVCEMGVSPILGTPPFWWDLRNFEQISFVRFSYEGKAKAAFRPF